MRNELLFKNVTSSIRRTEKWLTKLKEALINKNSEEMD